MVRYGNLAVAEDLYALALALAGLTMAVMIWYADQMGVLDESLLDVPRRVYLARSLAVPVVAGVVVACAALAPRGAPSAWRLIAVSNVVSNRISGVRRVGRPRHRDHKPRASSRSAS